jgi:hypothetical protein
MSLENPRLANLQIYVYVANANDDIDADSMQRVRSAIRSQIYDFIGAVLDEVRIEGKEGFRYRVVVDALKPGEAERRPS